MSLMVVPDHVRALIADPDRYEPQASATLLDFAAHYATAVLPLPTQACSRPRNMLA
jgi:hypothetical protein